MSPCREKSSSVGVQARFHGLKSDPSAAPLPRGGLVRRHRLSRTCRLSRRVRRTTTLATTCHWHVQSRQTSPRDCRSSITTSRRSSASLGVVNAFLVTPPSAPSSSFEQAMQPMLADMFWDFSSFQFNGFTRRCFTSTSWLHASWGRAPLRQWHSCGHVYPRGRVCRRLGGPTGFILPRRGGRRDVESVPVHPSSGRTNSSSTRSMSRRLS